jgi:hypothetical protein
MEIAYVLIIGGEGVTFEIKHSEHVVSLPEGSKPPPAGESFLEARVGQWVGVLSHDVLYGVPPQHQFTDKELERLYRRARGRS